MARAAQDLRPYGVADEMYWEPTRRCENEMTSGKVGGWF